MQRRVRSFIMASAVIVLAFVPVSGFASRVGGGDVTYHPKGAAQVVFHHEYHVNLKGQKCGNCHYRPFQMAANSYKMDMKLLTKGQFCGICHNGHKAFDLKPAGNCGKCHKD